MRRVFNLVVLACPRGGGRVRVIVTVQDPLAVQAILAHLARAGAPAPPGPAPPAPDAIKSTPPLDWTLEASRSPPRRPRLDRETAAAQDGSGRAGDRDANPRLRPLERAVPGLPPGFTGAAALAGRPPPQHRWR